MEQRTARPHRPVRGIAYLAGILILAAACVHTAGVSAGAPVQNAGCEHDCRQAAVDRRGGSMGEVAVRSPGNRPESW